MFDKLRQWFPPAEPPSGVPFHVDCPCGGSLQGYRQSYPHHPKCPKCGRPVFVFGLSPYPGATSAPRPAVTPQQRTRVTIIRLGIAVGLGSLALMFVLFLVAKWYFARPVAPRISKPSRNPEPVYRPRILVHIDKGEEALEEGSFHLAREQFDLAIAVRDKHPKALTRDENLFLNQNQRQAALAAELLPVSLVEVLRQADASPNDEAWRAKFESEYFGRAVTFCELIGADRNGRPYLNSSSDLQANLVSARIDVSDVELIQHLPLHRRQTWAIGVRLKSVRREDRAQWVFRFAPTSGVLITNEKVLLACQPDAKDKVDVDLLLERQAATLMMLPTPKPVSPRKGLSTAAETVGLR